MKHDLIIAGFGGQGILFAGQLLAYAGMLQGLEVSWLPSYGPEMRGGTANCTVVLADKRIRSPLVLRPGGLIVMNKPSLDKFEDAVKPGGVLVVNKSMVDRPLKRTDTNNLEVPADSIASELGSARVANLVALGAYLGLAGILDEQYVYDALEKVIPEHRSHLISINKAALQQGFAIGVNKRLGGNQND
ncbi:MAG: 2-oxoacid:acceptor oxidoreductase family protein [bacterium]